jgi:hypothetical protein
MDSNTSGYQAEVPAEVDRQALEKGGRDEAGSAQTSSLTHLDANLHAAERNDGEFGGLAPRIGGRVQLIEACDLLLGAGFDTIDIK